MTSISMSAAFRNCSSLSTGAAAGVAGAADATGVGAGEAGGGGAAGEAAAACGLGASGTVAGFSASGAAGLVVSAGICGLGSNLGSGFASSTTAGKMTAPFAASAAEPADWSGGRTPASCGTRFTPATG
ncbi:MAG TPA: hypothetical protein VLX28_22845 [Thermoanaerobaculia bacterium]|nr:hypothetical protein [Thermoanaerobaculia bacterium]